MCDKLLTISMNKSNADTLLVRPGFMDNDTKATATRVKAALYIKYVGI